MKRKLSLFIFFLTILFGVVWLPGVVWSGCATIDSVNGVALNIPCVDYSGYQFGVKLDLYENPADPSGVYFKFDGIYDSLSDNGCALLEDNADLSIPCVEILGVRYSAHLTLSDNFVLPGLYWILTHIAPIHDVDNQKPIANSVTLSVDSSVPYIVQQLSARDLDGDTIQFELISPVTGTGYADAYINPSSGKLYVTHEPSGNNAFTLSYRVSDGQLFSDPATVSVQVTYLSDEDKNTGRNAVDAELYASFALSTLNSRLLGAIGDAPTTPISVDLSANFPTPGDQGNQNSCVGWATAYALKSYQERVENGWPLNTPEHLFSPAFLYNQINGQQDRGSYINEALDLAVNTGLATLARMPYSDHDYLTQPSQAAFSEAVNFKAASWRRVNDISQIKAALANGRPVVGGISVYEQLMQLRGADSVYNTASGSNQGGHAITIVGYDDNRYGGALKVINSWGQAWGDGGFFWIPYSFAASGIMSEAYVLEDAENSQPVTPVEPTQPIPDQKTLPNLTVERWNADYDPHPQPRGSGSLRYSIKNTGEGSASGGAYVALILSRNPEFSLNDDMVVYEILPDLAPGQSANRGEANPIFFNFPDQLEGGTYYMTVVVDPMDTVLESLETDNVSPGNQPVVIQNTLPDLSVNIWYAEWDAYGYGTLTYEVINNGASSTTNTAWKINLILDRDQVVGNGNEIYLFSEPIQYILAPGGSVYRYSWNAKSFNLYQTYEGYSVPAGTYYMALWVDDLDVERESNELNNGSYSWGTVQIGDYWGSVNRSVSDGGKMTGDRSNPLVTHGNGMAYNGRRLPTADELRWKKIELKRSVDGRRGVVMAGENDPSGQQMAAGSIVSKERKTISAMTEVIFPTSSQIEMP